MPGKFPCQQSSVFFGAACLGNRSRSQYFRSPLSIGKGAMARLLGIVHMNPEVPRDSWNHKEEDVYGIGAVRTPEKFYEMFGIDVEKKTIEGHLCSFVHEGGRMHNMLVPKLRPDGMGIDYSDVTYRFKDPAP